MYDVVVVSDFKKKLKKKKRLPPTNVLASIFDELKDIASKAETYPHKRLIGKLKGQYKHKWGAYRALYRLDDENKKLIVLDIEARSNVYE